MPTCNETAPSSDSPMTTHARQAEAMEGASVDPVRAKRARIAKLVEAGQRVGYGLFLLAMVLFGVGFVTGFDGLVRTTIIGSLVVGSLVLAPAIVFGYAVKAADRDDRQRGF